MSQVVIENPVLNSPYREPGRHFRFTDEGITDEVVGGRRTSSYFIPIARPRKKGDTQLQFETEWTKDRIDENKLVNQIRARVKLWRDGGSTLQTEQSSGSIVLKCGRVKQSRVVTLPDIERRRPERT